MLYYICQGMLTLHFKWASAVLSAWLLTWPQSRGPSALCFYTLMFYCHLFTVGPHPGSAVFIVCMYVGGAVSFLVWMCVSIWVCVCVLMMKYERKMGRQPTWALYPSRLLSATSCRSRSFTHHALLYRLATRHLLTRKYCRPGREEPLARGTNFTETAEKGK